MTKPITSISRRELLAAGVLAPFAAGAGRQSASSPGPAPYKLSINIAQQKETGLTCVSIVGTGPSGGTTGFTRPGVMIPVNEEFT